MRYGGYGGYQCTGIVMYSLALSRILPCEVWNTEIMNHIISEGTQYYIHCINKTGESRPRYLGALGVFGEINVRGTLFVSHYAMGNEQRSTNLGRIRNILRGLTEFYESDFELAVLISAYFSYGIIKSENKLYFVDSHSKNINGDSVPNGFGGVRIYLTVNTLAEYIISISNSLNVQYELTFVSILEPVDIEGKFLFRIYTIIPSQLFYLVDRIDPMSDNTSDNISESVEETPLMIISESNESDTSSSDYIGSDSIESSSDPIASDSDDNNHNITVPKRKTGQYLTLKGFKLSTPQVKRLQNMKFQNAAYLRNSREKAPKQTTVQRLEAQKLRNRMNRAAETPAQKALRQQKDRDRHKFVYRPIVETEQEKAVRLGLAKQKRLDDRFKKSSYLFAAFNPEIPFDDRIESVPPLKLGNFDQSCDHCQAMFNENERNTEGDYNRCCGKDKIRIPIISVYHPTLIDLIIKKPDNRNILRDHFYGCIRQYNSKLAFAGIKTNFDPVNFDNTYRNKRGYLYKCHGNMYFNFPPMFNDVNDKHPPETAQYYIMDSDTAHLQRTLAWRNDNGLINDQVLRKLEDMIAEVNLYHAFFFNHKEELKRQLQVEPTECKMWLTRATLDMANDKSIAKQFILNSNVVAGEIAAVFKDTDGNPPDGIKIAIFPRKGHRQLINIRDPNVDPMIFPLLFPYGEPGYDFNLQHTRLAKNNTTTLKEFYKHRLHFRKDNENLYFKFGKLFQEYVVHSWIKIESNNLNWIRRNQNKLKITKYSGIMNHKSTMYTPENVDQGLGCAYILPSTVPVRLL